MRLKLIWLELNLNWTKRRLAHLYRRQAQLLNGKRLRNSNHRKRGFSETWLRLKSIVFARNFELLSPR